MISGWRSPAIPSDTYVKGEETVIHCASTMTQGERWSPRCTRFLVPLLLCLAAAGGWSQQLDVNELDTTAGRSFPFESYTGPQPVVQSVPQIAGIGEVLSRGLESGGTSGDYFGKYSVIRAFQPADTTLLSADIIVLGARAQIDDIRNVQRIVAGYLRAAFGYIPGQADRLAVLVTKYNAAYRGNIGALSQKYTPLVMSYLAADNAGIALRYTEWPGRTRLIVPLGHAAGAQAGAAGAPAGAPPTGPAGTVPAGSAAPGSTPGAVGSAGPVTGGAAAGSAAAGGAAAGGAASGGAGSPGTSAPAGAGPAGGAAQAGGTPPAGTAPAGGATAGGPSGPAASGGQTVPSSSTGGKAAAAGGTPASAEAGTPRTPGLFGIAWYWWLLALGALLVLALLVLLIVRLIDRLLRPSYEREFHQSVREGHPLVEMIVIPQNRRIGHRNVHYMQPGATAIVGSGRARFLIYFVPVPRRMAVLRYDGRTYSFVPLKSDLFPATSGPVSNCMDKVIPARSPRGYRFSIVFRRYIPPLEEINRLMRSTRAGAPRRLPPA
jgi:hypothetical protein